MQVVGRPPRGMSVPTLCHSLVRTRGGHGWCFGVELAIGTSDQIQVRLFYVCCLWVSGSDSDEAELEQRAFLPLFRLVVAVQVASLCLQDLPGGAVLAPAPRVALTVLTRGVGRMWGRCPLGDPMWPDSPKCGGHLLCRVSSKQGSQKPPLKVRKDAFILMRQDTPHQNGH